MFGLNETAAYCGGAGVTYDILAKEIAWIVIIVYSFVLAIVFFIQSAQAGTDFQKGLYRGYSFFIIGYDINRIIYIIADVEQWNNCMTILYYQLLLITVPILSLSSLYLMYTIERKILQMDKWWATKIVMVIAVVSLLFVVFINSILEYVDLIRQVIPIIGIIGTGLLVIIYLRMIVQSSGEIKTQSIMMAVGISLVIIGQVVDGEIFSQGNVGLPIWIPAILPFIGFSFIFYLQLKKGLKKE